MTLGILITYYNERELLTECLESLRRQTVPVDEILVYDDASQHPARDYVPSDLAVRVIQGGHNVGPGAGRNVLLRECASDQVHFHDSDDLFDPQWAARVKQALAEPGLDAVFSEISFFCDDGVPVSERVLGLKQLAQEGDLVRFCLRGSMLTPSGTYRKSCVQRIGGYRENLWQSEDFDFHVRLAASGISHVVIEDVLVLCRARADSRSQKRIEVFACAFQAVELLARELPVQYRPDLAERAAGLGATLFQLGARQEARAAFRFSREFGPPRLLGQNRWYRALGKTFGLEFAERVGSLYRGSLPKPIRRAIGRSRPALP